MHAHHRVALATLLAACGLAIRPAHAQAVTVFRAAKIYTMERDSVYDAAPAVAVRDGRIVAVGDSARVFAALAGVAVRVDTTFRGSILFPGFVEAHTHMQPYGFFTSDSIPYVGYWPRPTRDGGVQPGVPTADSLVSVLRSAVAAQSDTTQPVVAFGADPIYFPERRLTATILDRASSTRPIVVQLSSGHIVVVNTPMLTRIEHDTVWKRLVATPGTVVGGAANPTGEFDEDVGVDAVHAMLVNDAQIARLYDGPPAFARAADLMRNAGITTASDLLFADATPKVENMNRAAYEAAARRDPAFPRVYLSYSVAALVRNYGDTAARHIREVARHDSDRIHTGAVKVIVDGSIQAYTAVLSTPYVNPAAPRANPIWNTRPDSLAGILLPFWREHIRTAAHVNGDSATLELIRAVRALQDSAPWTGHRTVFEHNQSAFAEQYDSIAAIGATVNLFPAHVYYWGPQHERYTLGARAADIAPADWVIARGIPFSLHSDAPVTPAAPLFSAWAAVNRIMPVPGDSVLGPQHRITVGQAMHAITMGGAYLLGAENEIGSLRAGKLADFTVLDADPFATPPLGICAIRVVATVVGGSIYRPASPQSSCTPYRPNGAVTRRP